MLHELFWELHQQNRIRTAEIDAATANNRSREAELKVRTADMKAEKALLLCEALWTILRDKLGVDEKELLDRVRQIDLIDDRLDDRVRRPPVQCPSCRRESSKRFHVCMYCGSDLPDSSFAR